MVDRDVRDAFERGEGMAPENGQAEQKLCGLGIAFKPDKRNHLFVKRLVPGGPAERSKLVEVSASAALPYAWSAARTGDGVQGTHARTLTLIPRTIFATNA